MLAQRPDSVPRPLTTSVEWTGRGYKGEILWDDPWFLDTDNELKARLSALTFDFDGYSKFEYGGRIDLSRKFSKFYQAGVVISYREVKLQNIDIEPQFVGPHKYTVGSVGFTHTLDMRDNKVLPLDSEEILGHTRSRDKQLLLVDDADHDHLLDRKEVWAALDQFLDRVAPDRR